MKNILDSDNKIKRNDMIIWLVCVNAFLALCFFVVQSDTSEYNGMIFAMALIGNGIVILSYLLKKTYHLEIRDTDIVINNGSNNRVIPIANIIKLEKTLSIGINFWYSNKKLILLLNNGSKVKISANSFRDEELSDFIEYFNIKKYGHSN